jgi:hypothetical protein
MLSTLDGSMLEVTYGDTVAIKGPSNDAVATPVDLGESCGITVWSIDTVSAAPVKKGLETYSHFACLDIGVCSEITFF